ncbi:MAG: 30S ribosomal protein S20 [Phycisphaerae bacterium]|jgi:small subunit ribosomal protein S20|nr:30S ribosomal protein S20 [Phycisphaerae bacterium]MCZ2401256.1 30S ribosomal protein S20 [Phycisphaerae bacterium]NUQ49927.1 30S ribosomal protein S20 [Phycisphaerae bacterium]
MAHSASAQKRVRQNEKRRMRNRAQRSALRKVVKTTVMTLSGQDAAGAEKQFRLAVKALDQEAARGLIHRNAAARSKSRLAKRLNALKKTAGGK